MSLPTTLLVSLLAVVPFWAAAESPVRVELHRSVELNGVVFTLGDIARISANGTDAETLARVALGGSPRVGQTRALTRAEIAARVGRALPDLVQRDIWSGAEVVLVRSQGQAVTAGELTHVAQRELESWLAMHVESFEAQPAGALRDLLVPFGLIEMHARPVGDAQLRRRVAVWVDVSVDGVRYQSLPVWFAVQAWAQGLVAKRDFEARDGIDAAGVEARRVDVARAGGAVATLEDLRRVRTRHAIAADTPLRRSSLERTPAVEIGKPVIVVARAGGVEIVLGGRALSEGEVGDTVEVVTREGRGSFTATVIEHGVVVPEGG